MWQLSHITPSYLGRTASGAVLLADGLIHDNPISIVGCRTDPAVSISNPCRQPWVMEQGVATYDGMGLRALIVSTALAFAARSYGGLD
jgi:hypothetical protein